MNMKRFFLLTILLCLLFNITAQTKMELDSISGDFMAVFENKLSANDIYSRTREWISKTFKTYKATVQLEDNENHKIVLKGRSEMNGIDLNKNIKPCFHTYTITVECKDNKYRLKIEDNTVEKNVMLVNGTEVLTDTYENHFKIYARNIGFAQQNIEDLERYSKMDLKALDKKEAKVIKDKIDFIKKTLRYPTIEENENFYSYLRDYEILQMKENIYSLALSLDKFVNTDDDF